VSAVYDALGAVQDTSAMRTPLSKARRALQADSPDLEAARTEIGLAVAAYDADIAWRAPAAAQLLEPLAAYESAIADTIGLRKQARLPSEQVPDIAACLSHHRDVSLRF